MTKKREVVSQADIQRVIELRKQAFTRTKIAEAMGTTFARVKHIIKLIPKPPRRAPISTHKVWYTEERKTFTDAMPNPFPRWWCDEQGLDHNFYRPLWTDN